MARYRKRPLAEMLGIKEGFNVTFVGLWNKGSIDFGIYKTYEQLPRILLLRILNIIRQSTGDLPEGERKTITKKALISPLCECRGNVQGNQIPGVKWSYNWPHETQDVILFFTKYRWELAMRLPTLKPFLAEHGVLWIAWPKVACEIVTDLNQRIVRKLCQKYGLGGVKGCTIDRDWSTLKFIFRRRIEMTPTSKNPIPR